MVLFSLSAASCLRPVIYPGQLTATAGAEQLATLLVFISTPLTSPEVKAAATQVTVTPQPTLTPTPVPSITDTAKPPLLYYSQSGDTLYNISVRFSTWPEEITSPDPIPTSGFINPNQLLIIPDRIKDTGPTDLIMPDSEVVYSPSAVDFDITDFITHSTGYIKTYREYLEDGWNTSAQIVARVANENSINPRILLAMVEQEGHWVNGKPQNLAEMDYPAGWKYIQNRGLYRQLNWTAKQLSIAYYGWRAGTLTELEFPDKSRLRLSPSLNAGSVAVQYLFSKLYNQQEWNDMLYTDNGFPALHKEMFGDPWGRAHTVEPLFPPDLKQPELELPFLPGHTWSFTGGPHHVWFPDGGALAALDFAPPSDNPGCGSTDEFATAVSSGTVVRSANGIVVIDLDGDGKEQTGWSIFFLHIGHTGRVPLGTFINTDEPIGHPSCEGGNSTGTHIHMARKYNGEWLAADGPVPFVMSGFTAHNGTDPYLGTLTRGNQTIVAHTSVEVDSIITRPSSVQPTPVAQP
jgi:LasA protease